MPFGIPSDQHNLLDTFTDTSPRELPKEQDRPTWIPIDSVEHDFPSEEILEYVYHGYTSACEHFLLAEPCVHRIDC